MGTGSNARSTSPWRSNAHWAAALLGYCLVTIALTWPLSRELGVSIPGTNISDFREFVWSQWWWWHALGQGLDPTHINVIQYPSGMEFPLVYLMSQVFLLGLPLTALTGPTIAQNLLFLAAFPTTGLAAYALCLDWGADRRAAFLGGLIWAFFPNRMGHALAGHQFFLLTFSLPWMALAWSRLLRAPGLREAVGTGLVTAFACTLHPLDTAYFIVPVITALLIVRGLGWLPNAKATRHWLAMTALAISISAALFLPLAWPTLTAQRNDQLGYLAQTGATTYSIDLATLFWPAPDSPLPLADTWRTAVQASTGAPFENIGTLGWLVPGLGLVGVWRGRRWSALWATLAVGGAILALGPVLKFGGIPVTLSVEPGDLTRVVLPYAGLANLPVFGWSRTPARFLVLTALGLAMLAAQGLTVILGHARFRSYSAGGVCAALACSIVVAEYTIVWPFPTEPVEARPILQGLTGPVLNLPWGGVEGNLFMLYWQTQHEQPMIGGRVYRDVPGYRARYDGLRNLLLEPA